MTPPSKSTSNRSAAPIFRAFQDTLQTLAASDASVLMTGEIGVGKSRAARLLHAGSGRADGSLVEVSLAAIAPSLVESELFGHVQGAFTDAKGARRGCFMRADGGTLVLEDIDALPLATQVKLLRVLQERVVEPLGAEVPEPVDVRLVVTTSANLEREVAEGRFREDLFYRLAVVPLEVPPLRMRKADLPALTAELMEAVSERSGVEPRPLTEDAAERLAAHPWPGNVRELENALERALVLAAGRPEEEAALGADDFDFLDEGLEGAADWLAREALARGLELGELEAAMLEAALAETRGNISAAARVLGITRRALEYRIEAKRKAEQAGAEA